MKLHVSKELSLPLDAVTQTFALLAMRGVGKTHGASVIAEELCKAGLPFRVIEPTGAWWGLRASADGKGPGYAVTVLGGDHGDIPLEETSGKLIANLSIEEVPSLILDLSHFSKSAMRRFVADFCEEIYRVNRIPLHLIFDEADAFAPQKPRPDEMRMLGAIDDIVRRGRIRGLGCTLVTQRSAVINKDVLTQMEVLIALRTAHPRDRAPVLEWMKVHATAKQLAAVEESLASLPKGDAWVMSAGWLDLFKRIHFRQRETFNSSATPAPGEKRIEPRKLAEVDLKALQAKMATTIEKAKANDPALLRRRIAELEAEARKRPAAATSAPAKVQRVEVPVLKDGQMKRLERLVERMVVAQDRLAQAQQVVVSEAGNLRTVLGQAAKHSVQFAKLSRLPVSLLDGEQSRPAGKVPSENYRNPISFPPVPRPARMSSFSTRKEEADGSAPPEGALGKGERRILAAVAQHQEGVTREQLTVLTGYRRSSRDTYLQRLRARGLVNDGERITATGAGFANLGPDFEALPTGAMLLEHWRQHLPTGERAILEVVVAAYPEPVERERISEATEYQRSSRDTYLQRLRSRHLITEPSRGTVRASDTLFLAR